jgi:phenylpropionate dioxygenase-like ring-hydroxylating dioxygenase large terminal subunit
MSVESYTRRSTPRHFDEPTPTSELQANVVREGMPVGPVRVDFLPKDAYISPAFAQREAELLWPRIWQIACREEEIPAQGDYITYDIVDDSIIVVRTAEGIKAHHNACPHRGRPLADGPGRTQKFVCRFHGWQFNLSGENVRVVDRDDWGTCLKNEEIRLKGVQVGTWGGFVFVNMDPAAEPLEQFLSPLNELCKKYEFEKMRYRWYRTVELPLNWKAALEGFDEAYHVQTSHPQLIRDIEDYSNSGTFGIHSAFWYDPLPDGRSRYQRSSRLAAEEGVIDYRQHILGYVREMDEQLGAAITPRAHEAAKRMMAELPATASSIEVLTTWRRLWQEAAEAEGAGWPDLSVDEIRAARQDWHIFPNAVILMSGLDGLLAYRARPHGHDPDKCIYDVWSLVRYKPGAEPKLKREYFNRWQDCDWGRILTQDFGNLERVQRGMKSRGFAGSRPNPHQEQAISNFHRMIWRVVGE